MHVNTYKGYEMVIGLEVHVELKTAAKIFCDCPTTFGAPPNTQCCPVCMGMPGTLPVLNSQVVEFAIKAGLATGCRVSPRSRQDRKNYFYPDLPKAYQISQYDLPLCEGGALSIETEGGQKTVGITRIHIEEDAGKLVHLPGGGTLIDCNRCGVPLIEIVSEPDIRSAEEAKAYLQKLRAVILYTGISDCKMQEGSLRCDVNLSVRPAGEEALGTRTEMKNLNSFQSVTRAIEYEFRRQVDALEAGEAIVQETRRFDQNSGKTLSMRRKENANDYRYFPDPDLPSIRVDEAYLARLQGEIPALPDARKADYVARFGLTPYAAEQLTARREVADYFEAAAVRCRHPALAANLILGEVLSLLGEDGGEIPLSPAHLAALCELWGEGKINSSTCRRALEALWRQDGPPEEWIETQGLWQITDETALAQLAQEAVRAAPRSASDYRRGKKAALQALVGRVMKATQGRADPARTQDILRRLLDR